jgi:hypothetical protein
LDPCKSHWDRRCRADPIGQRTVAAAVEWVGPKQLARQTGQTESESAGLVHEWAVAAGKLSLGRLSLGLNLLRLGLLLKLRVQHSMLKLKQVLSLLAQLLLRLRLHQERDLRAHLSLGLWLSLGHIQALPILWLYLQL